MSFLTLNGTPIPCRSNACDVKHGRHRQDLARMFNGEMRVSGGAVFRTFTITTAFHDETNYAAAKALIESVSLPLTMAGDLSGGTISVMPEPGSWTPVQTADGFRRQAKFTLHETITVVEPDTSATPWLFCRSGVGYYTDEDLLVPAGIGDQILVWQDQSGNGRDLISGAGGLAGGTDDYRPTRFDADTIRNGLGSGYNGRTGFRIPDTTALTAMEVLIGLRALDDPPANNIRSVLWAFGTTGYSSSAYYPDTDGNIKEGFGLTTMHDAGDPSTDLTGFNCYNVSGSTATDELKIRLNNVELLSYTLVGAEAFYWNHDDPAGPLLGVENDGKTFDGWFRDFVIFDALLTDTQRLAWFNYLTRVTSIPPL